MNRQGSFWGVALVFVSIIGATAIIFQLNSKGGQANVKTTGNVATTTIGDLFKVA
jgi:hypothetical protein